jgi:pyruvate-formate lyase-activating enzyme
MANKIYYGAGSNARKHIKQWAREIGEPICFVDADNRKWGTQFPNGADPDCDGGGYRITSLYDAISGHPDYELWLTSGPENLNAVVDYLIERGVPQERIHCCEDVEYRRGCRFLGQYIVICEAAIQPCCSPAYAKKIEYSDTIHTEETVNQCIDRFQIWSQDTLALLRTDAKTDCDECSALQWGYYPRTPKIRFVNAGAGFANTTCNCRCIYCSQRETAFKQSNQILDGYDINRIVFERFGESVQWVAIGDGEITILPHRKKLLELLKERGVAVCLMTNALLFDPDISEVLRRRNSQLAVSLDAGTSDTYFKIKGVNAFSKVIANLKRYAEKGACDIMLKYILLPGMNDNFDDINGFIQIAVDLGAGSICLSQDLVNFSKIKSRSGTQNIDEMHFSGYAYFAARCKEAGLKVSYALDCFTASDCSRMNKLCEAL